MHSYILMVSCSDPEFCDCVLDVKDRQDCGAEKITPKQCKAMGCCYNRKPHKAVWCFKKRARSELYKTSSPSRADLNRLNWVR